MFGMHQQTNEIVLVCIQTKQYSQTYIINAAFHCTIHRFGMISVVTFRPGRVQVFIVCLVIGLLKEDVCSDTGFLQFAVILYRCGGNVHVYPSDGSVFVMNTVNGLNGLQDVFNRVVLRIFSGFQSQTLMPHILQGNHFPGDFFLGKFLAVDGLVLAMIRTIYTTVYAVV